MFLWIFASYGADGVPAHSNMFELAQYSPYADFVIKVRNFFMNRFEVYRDDFGGIDGEVCSIILKNIILVRKKLKNVVKKFKRLGC